MSDNTVDPGDLRKLGMIEQRQEGLFALRLHAIAGDFSPEQIRKVADVAQKFGRGQIHLSTRQGMEIHFVPRMYLDSARKELEAAGIAAGASGPTVRIITGCPGNATCKRGMIETKEIARRLDETYFRQEVPHKFKISVTGCPNNCAKATENDVGVMGGIEPRWQKSECYNCSACVYACPVGAISVDDGEYMVDRAKCINCGTCSSSCPNAAWTAAKRGYMLWLGGTMGKFPRMATRIPGVIALKEKETLFSLIDRAIGYYRTHGRERERFGHMLDRVGVTESIAKITGSE
jgi:anaerobic sulfite reductase subunit C